MTVENEHVNTSGWITLWSLGFPQIHQQGFFSVADQLSFSLTKLDRAHIWLGVQHTLSKERCVEKQSSQGLLQVLCQEDKTSKLTMSSTDASSSAT